MGSLPVAKSYLDSQFTDLVISSMGPDTAPRTREIMTSLIRHLHEFVKEAKLTADEWKLGIDLLTLCGKLTDSRLDHLQLLANTVGMESLIEELTLKNDGGNNGGTTAAATLGPFYREDAPCRENGSSIISNAPKEGQTTYLYGRVIDCTTDKPVKGATVNVWQASTNGLYDVQDLSQVAGNLRGQFRTDAEGRYSFYCLRPVPYAVQEGLPATTFLDFMDRHHYRPAHIHLVVTHPDFSTLVTQIYPKDDPYLRDDVAFAVVESLVREFVPRVGDPRASLELEFDVHVAPARGEVGS